MNTGTRIQVLTGLALGVIAMLPTSAQADLIYNNFYQDLSFNDGYGFVNNQPVTEYEKFVRYTPSTTFLLDSLVLPVFTPGALINYLPAAPAGTVFGDDMQVTVYADNNGVPGTALETISMPDSLVLNSGDPLVSAAPPVTIPFSGTTMLQAGQAYWIAVAEIGGSVVMWNDNAAIDLPFTVLFRVGASSTFHTSSQTRPGMQIYGTPVPGPGGLAMVLVLGSVMRGRRRRG